LCPVTIPGEISQCYREYWDHIVHVLLFLCVVKMSSEYNICMDVFVMYMYVSWIGVLDLESVTFTTTNGNSTLSIIYDYDLVYPYHAFPSSIIICDHFNSITKFAARLTLLMCSHLWTLLSFICMFCRSLFVLLYFFFWPWCCLFFFDIRVLITPLVFSLFLYFFLFQPSKLFTIHKCIVHLLKPSTLS